MNQKNEDLRILLWDIDGTLIRSNRQGAFKDYTAPLLEKVFGTVGQLDDLSVSGMTDLQIIGEALKDHGFTHEQIRHRLEDIKTCYLEEMVRVTTGEELFRLLPGVRQILELTDRHPRYRNALLTGNIEPAANLKMRLVGLTEFFTLPGAFGDDSHDRRDLPSIASSRISKRLSTTLRPEQFIVIGDTPNDIACAKHFGARVVAVATGRSHSASLLNELGADAVLNSLIDTDEVIRTFDAL